jgi:uncharacterized alpha-E superfamily protein
MPRSLVYCYQDIIQQLVSLEADYEQPYEAVKLANKIQSDLTTTSNETFKLDDLLNFTSMFISENAALSLLVEKEFKFNP